MQRVPEPEVVTDCVRGGKRHRARPDERPVKERDSEEPTFDGSHPRPKPFSNSGRIGEGPMQRDPIKRERARK